jgi:hypothetical protein
MLGNIIGLMTFELARALFLAEPDCCAECCFSWFGSTCVAALDAAIWKFGPLLLQLPWNNFRVNRVLVVET